MHYNVDVATEKKWFFAKKKEKKTLNLKIWIHITQFDKFLPLFKLVVEIENMMLALHYTTKDRTIGLETV